MKFSVVAFLALLASAAAFVPAQPRALAVRSPARAPVQAAAPAPSTTALMAAGQDDVESDPITRGGIVLGLLIPILAAPYTGEGEPRLLQPLLASWGGPVRGGRGDGAPQHPPPQPHQQEKQPAITRPRFDKAGAWFPRSPRCADAPLVLLPPQRCDQQTCLAWRVASAWWLLSRASGSFSS